jgi:hypothetical protein
MYNDEYLSDYERINEFNGEITEDHKKTYNDEKIGKYNFTMILTQNFILVCGINLLFQKKVFQIMVWDFVVNG